MGTKISSTVKRGWGVKNISFIKASTLAPVAYIMPSSVRFPVLPTIYFKYDDVYVLVLVFLLVLLYNKTDKTNKTIRKGNLR